MADLKISQMTDGGLVEITDEIPVNRGGQNYKVKVGEAASYEVGSGDSDLPTGLDVTNKINNAISNVPDENVKISIDDSESGFLEDKIIAGTNITIAKDVDSSGFETLTINSSGGGGSADDISYDNSTSGLAATEVQGAIDELSLGKYDSSDLASQSEAETGTDNTVLMTPLRTAQALAALGGGGGSDLINIQQFTSSGTYDKTTNNPKYIVVIVVGRGGNGGNSAGASSGGGGGGGGCSIKRILNATLSNTTTVTIGTTCSFGAHCSASSGAAGTSAPQGLGGAGGVGTGGDLNFTGSYGTNGINGSRGGDGGNSILCGAGRGAASTTAESGAPNSGSGGGGSFTSSGGANGGTGGSGTVIVFEYK